MQENGPIHIMISTHGKNTELEFIAFNEVLNHVSTGDRVYTDCQRIIDLILKRDPNYDYQRDLLNRIDNVCITAIKIDGHKPTRDKDYDDKQFSLVDKCVRKHLRTICK